MVSSGSLEAVTHPISTQSPHKMRLPGLDMARFLAFVGMVLVNFKLAANASISEASPQILVSLSNLLEGRAAALFVILAGLGIGIGLKNALAKGKVKSDLRLRQAKRGFVLFVFGLLNLIIFEADILHYYGLYFLCACLIIGMGRRALLSLAFAIILLSPVLMLIWNYETGWDWDNLHYQDMWSVTGFIRHTLYNGFHPILPWIAFLLLGMALAQMELTSTAKRIRIAAAGGILMMAGYIFGQMSQQIAALPELAKEADLLELIAVLTSTSPMPPSPIYMLSASGSALIMVVICLWLGDWFGKKIWVQPISATGQQALTLYIAHILIGMGVMEEMGWISATGSPVIGPDLGLVFAYAALFILCCILYSFLWKRYFGSGPLERLLRKLAS